MPQASRKTRRRDDDLARTLIEALATALPPEEARVEVERLLAALRSALPAPGRTRLRALLARTLRGWQRRGLRPEAVARVALALLLPGMLRDREGEHADPYGGMRPLLDQVPVPMLVGDSELKVRVCNRSFAALAPAAYDAVEGRALAELLAPDCCEELPRRLQQGAAGGSALETGRVTLAAVPGREFLGTWIPLTRPDGANAWLLRLASGQAASLEDLGERLRRQESLKEKLAALLTVSRAVVGSLDLDQILDTIARETRRVIQVDESTVFLLDERSNVLIPAACDVQSFRDEVMAVRLPVGQGITGGVALAGRGRIVNDALNDPDAVQVPGTPVEQSSLLCVPLLVREKVTGVITLTRTGERIFQPEDLELATLFAGQCSAAIANARLYEEVRSAYQELREAQSQLVQSAKLNALGEMAGGVAHDFNNILAAILGRTQLLLQGAADPAQRRSLEVIEQAALDGAQAVRRVQEFTRLRQDERFEPLNVGDVLQDALELTRAVWEAESKRRGITLDVGLEQRAARLVAGNASELREVFTNLILNALDAMPWGGTLTLASADEGDEIRIRVADTGVGMDEATRARIFDPFFTTKPVQGTGLGLSVAYGIITRHRGRIEVESRPGQGTVFSIWLPAAAAPACAAAPASPGPLARLRVLAVDDEEPVLHVLGDLLGLLGQDVQTALGGAAGIERFASGRFDVVFTDLGMPAVNGWDVVQAIKSRSPDVPVVVVTGWGVQIENRVLHTRGADFVIPKPFTLDDVRDVLQQIGARASRAA